MHHAGSCFSWTCIIWVEQTWHVVDLQKYRGIVFSKDQKIGQPPGALVIFVRDALGLDSNGRTVAVRVVRLSYTAQIAGWSHDALVCIHQSQHDIHESNQGWWCSWLYVLHDSKNASWSWERYCCLSFTPIQCVDGMMEQLFCRTQFKSLSEIHWRSGVKNHESILFRRFDRGIFDDWYS